MAMPARLEIALRDDLFDAEGATLARKARDYFDYRVSEVRTVRVVTIDAALSETQLGRLQDELFTNPVTENSSYKPLPIKADWVIWVGFLPGVKDAAGETAAEAIEDYLDRPWTDDEACYTSKLYFISEDKQRAADSEVRESNLTPNDVHRITRELLANDLIHRWKIWRGGHRSSDGSMLDKSDSDMEEVARWDKATGMGYVIPSVQLAHTPRVEKIPIGSDDELMEVSDRRHLFLDPNDVPAIRKYFLKPSVLQARKRVGLDLPTDVELEYIAQARSDHCNHNTFRGLFNYCDLHSGEKVQIDSLFRTCISQPTKALAKKKDWVISVLWDNAGVGRFDDDMFYTITGETHNSPSNMEAYGGSITGIVGVYRDPMGTGKGSKLIMGTYGFCVGPRDYDGPLQPKLHPRRLLDGIIEGVRDGGNKSGVPTPFGGLFFDECYLGKCLVFVSALGIMPAIVDGERSDRKETSPGDLVFMCGGRVGKDGIHGVTASSSIYDEHTPAGHVQIGDPYTQKKCHDFLVEARDSDMISFITDCGGGGLSSAVGESAIHAGGVKVDLDKIPRKYDGLDQWEIWISESQERMVVAVNPKRKADFLALADRHAVEATVIGEYENSGHVHLKYKGKTCAYMELDFFASDFPQWVFDAEWTRPEERGLSEPTISDPDDANRCLLAMLERPNIASKEWIQRQYDHEVQGGSVIKPLVGVDHDMPSDASVTRPVLASQKGLAITQALNPTYSRIDAHAMTAVTIDEAVRRLIAVGGDPDHIGGIDNFCWPEIRYDNERNPDGKLKAAQLVRSCLALKSSCLAMGIPLLSGKDSMYIDGDLAGRFGEKHRVSGLPTLQFTAVSVIPNIGRCVTMEPKQPGDLVYLLGETGNELGGSEYYEMYGQTGLNVPTVDPDTVFPMYRDLAKAIDDGLIASAHGVYRGGLGVHAAMMVMGGGLGLELELIRVPVKTKSETQELTVSQVLYSESAGRFLVTVPAANADRFEACMADHVAVPIGRVREDDRLQISDLKGGNLIDLSEEELRESWMSVFGHLS
jgi:phosphoribosylformylglycinamidine synthase subunit PurSL